MSASAAPDRPSAPSSILVDVRLPNPEPLSPALVAHLASLRVVLLGWVDVPEQTSPAQARDRFGSEAETALAGLAEGFQTRGADVATRLVYTGDQLATISRVSTEEAADAILIPAPMDALEHVLVPLRGRRNAPRIALFVADLVTDPAARVTLTHVLEEGESEAAARREVLEPAAQLLTGRGIDASAVRQTVLHSADPAEEIVRLSGEYDLVVVGETEPSVRDILFGSVPEQIVREAEVPVVIVRDEQETVEEAERAARRAP
jgi:nucleotide-binding universal stress UspA family protein